MSITEVWMDAAVPLNINSFQLIHHLPSGRHAGVWHCISEMTSLISLLQRSRRLLSANVKFNHSKCDRDKLKQYQLKLNKNYPAEQTTHCGSCIN